MPMRKTIHAVPQMRIFTNEWGKQPSWLFSQPLRPAGLIVFSLFFLGKFLWKSNNVPSLLELCNFWGKSQVSRRDKKKMICPKNEGIFGHVSWDTKKV